MIMASESLPSTKIRFLGSSRDCIRLTSTRERASDLQSVSAWFSDMEDAFGLSQKEKDEGQPSASHFQEKSSNTEWSSRKLSIVLVEDNQTDVFLVKEALEHHGVNAVLTCHRDGEEMLRYIDDIDAGASPCPDVILLDLNLPRHNGKVVLERMRQSRVCGDVPVIVVTSSRALEDQADVARLGATRYFYKSIDYDEAMTLGAVVLEVTRWKDPS